MANNGRPGMKLSYTHPAASNGLPVFLDDKGKVMGYSEGFWRIRKKFRLRAADLAEICGVSHRTIDGYAIGRKPTAQVLGMLARYLKSLPRDREF